MIEQTDRSVTVTLLGTGGPEMSVGRQGPATLVSAGSTQLLFDAGRGVLQRLFECEQPINDVTRVFLTHLHSDHIEGLVGLWVTPWFLLGRRERLQVWGPVGTRAAIDGLRAFLGHDVEHRVAPDTPADAALIDVHEFDGPGIVFESGPTSVEAVAVEHGDGNPAFGFVVRHHDASVALSGDCTYSAGFAAASHDVDVIVHNVFAPSAALLIEDEHKRGVALKLASPEQAARVFSEANPRLAVYSHVIQMDSSVDTIVTRTRRAGYLGDLVVGADGMRISVGERIRIDEPKSLYAVADATGRMPTGSVVRAVAHPRPDQQQDGAEEHSSNTGDQQHDGQGGGAVSEMERRRGNRGEVGRQKHLRGSSGVGR